MFSVEIPASQADSVVEPASFTSKFDVFNDIDFSKIKTHESMSQETLALSGYLTYKGEKIYVDNGGCGGSTTFIGGKLTNEIGRLIKQQVSEKAPDIEGYLLDLDMAVNWSQSDAFGVIDFDEYMAG